MNTTPLDHVIGSTTLADRIYRAGDLLARMSRLWRHRRDVGRLLHVDDHMLADIGLSRQDVMGAMAAPFDHDPSHHLIRARDERRFGKRFSRRDIRLS